MIAITIYVNCILQVSFGQNISNNVGQLEYTAGSDTAVIAGGVTSGVHVWCC